jgi:hypothetical protein
VLTTSMPVSTMLLGWLIARLRGASLIVDVRDLPTDLAIELGYFRAARQAGCCAASSISPTVVLTGS